MKSRSRKIIKTSLLCALILGLWNNNPYNSTNAAEYNISSFDELVNNAQVYQSGDIINTVSNITASKNIGDIFTGGGNFIINGDKNNFSGNSKKGFTVNKNTNLTIDNFNLIENFSTNNNGGVFESNGTLTINDTSFTNNLAAKGGVVFNKGTLNIYNSVFENNGNLNKTTFGGAVRSESGTLNISNSSFKNNYSKSYGGAIATSNTQINITDSIFEGNETQGRGGVLSSNAYTTIRDSVFKNNTSGSYGGALNINNDVYINNSLFQGNKTVDSAGRVNGGAIRAESGNLLINNSTFTGNSASWGGAVSSDKAVNMFVINSIFENNVADRNNPGSVISSGGAITNGSNLTIINSVIRNNTAAKRGGGVNFNGSVLNIVANGQGSGLKYANQVGNTVFEGNTLKDGTSNGLQVYQGYENAPVVNLNAGNGGTITFNDNIIIGDSDPANIYKDAINININKDLILTDIAGHNYYVPTDGTIVLNSALKGINDTNAIINLYNGTLKIGNKGAELINVSMNLEGGTIDTRNNQIDYFAIRNFNINKNTNWRMDVDLNNGMGDYLNIVGDESSANGANLILETIRLTSDIKEEDRIVGSKHYIEYSNKIKSDGTALAYLPYGQNLLSYITTNSTYSVESLANTRGSFLEFTYEGKGDLPLAVSKSGIRIYSGTGDENIMGWFNDNNNLQGEKLIIWGNDYSVKNASGGALQGITVGVDGKNQTFEIHEVNEWSGFSDSYQRDVSGNLYVYGGAFAIVGGQGNSGTLNIDKVNFSNNNVGTVDNPNYRSYGGAISITNSSSAAFAHIDNSSFSDNTAIGRDGYGGAVSISLGKVIMDNTSFNNNTAKSVKYNGANGMNAYGGAIFLTNNDSKLSISDSGFSGNTATAFESGGGYQRAYGGAIATEQSGTSTLINRGAFIGNKAEGYSAYGGAIYNNGTMTIIDSVFMYNNARATGTVQGGALMNSGTLNLLALEDQLLFTGNSINKVKKEKDGSFTTVSTDSQALYNTSTVNMNAAKDVSINFFDKIDGANGILNINKSGIRYTDFKNNYTAPVSGNVVLNNTVKNQTVNLYGGILSIGKDPTELASGDKYFENVSLNGYGGTFDLINNQINTINLNKLTLNGNTGLSLDVDLAAKKSDFLNVTTPVSGSKNLVIDTIKVVTDMNEGINRVDTKYINQNISNAIVSETSKTVSTNDYVYNVSLIDNNTTLRFEKASASLGLPEAVARPDITEFDMTRDELVAEWLDPTFNNMQGDLKIIGNNHSLIAQNHLEGINTNGNTLTIFEVGNLYDNIKDDSMRNFDNAIINTNKGTVNITHSVITNNVAKNSFIDLAPPYEQDAAGDDITTEFVAGNGAAIENLSGRVNIDGAIITGNNADNLGGAIYNADELHLHASEGNIIRFVNNYAMVYESLNKYANDIYQTADGITDIHGDGGTIYFGGGFAGEGYIEKTGNNKMILASTSDSSKYTGEFFLTGGTLTVENGAGFFGGQNEVTDGILNWDTSKVLADTAALIITGGITNILSNGHMVLDNKTKIVFRNVKEVAIQEGGVLENKSNLTVFGNEFHGYNDGKETTYGTFKNTGTLTMDGDNSQFKGKFLQTEGNTIAEDGSKIFANGDLQGGTITFNGSSTIDADSTFTSANSSGAKTILLNNSTNSSSILGVIASAANKNLNIIISNSSDTNQVTTLDNISLNEDIVSLTIRDNVTYDGNIDVGANAKLNIEADNYDISFNNSITDINGSSKLQLSTFKGHSITLDGNSMITGNANVDEGGIIKDGDGTLYLSGKTSGYTGNFTQYEGKTEVSTNGFLFSGTKNILGGTLEINSNTGIYYNDLHLADNTTLIHKSATPDGGTINTDSFTFKGSGANAIFEAAAGLTTKPSYNLGANIQNNQNNSITFNNSKVTFGTDSFTGNTTYNINNSRIELGASSSEYKNYVFGNLNSTDTAIDLKVSFVDDGGTIKLQTDTIKVENTDNAGDNIFEVGNIIIHDASLENGTLVYNTVNDVLQGSSSFKNQASSTVIAEGATTIYEYELSLTDSKKSIQLEGVGAADENSLNKVNIKDIKRFFNFSKGKEGAPEYYYNAKSLEATGTGDFVVSGATGNAADSILSGYLIDRHSDGSFNISDKKGSLFNMADKTVFTIQNLTVQDTYKDGVGSVISIGTPELSNALASATVENLIIQRAETTCDGGALYNNGGTITVNNSQLISNHSDSLGGAIKNETGNLNIFNTILGSENNANTAESGGAIATGAGSSTDISYSDIKYNTASQNGGAVFNAGDLTISESVSLTNNTAASGRGGAIYNSGSLTISSKTDADILFEKNNDSTGLNDIYQTGSETLTFTGDGGKIGIMSGIAGDGNIVKDGISELVLGTDSINSNFTGNFTQNSGFTSVYGEFFGGQSTINGGTLNWNTADKKDKDAVLTVNKGTLNLNGYLVLNNAGDKINSESKLNINPDSILNVADGYVSIDRNGNNEDFANYDKWEGGILQTGGKIDYDIDQNGLVQVAGGEFNIIGGHLTLEDGELKGHKLTSSIAKEVNLNIENNSVLTINSANANLTLNSGDKWNTDATIDLQKGTLNYTDNIGNGKIKATGGNINITESTLTMNDAKDFIADSVNIYLGKNSFLEVNEGNLNLNSSDISNGVLKLNNNGTITMKSFTNNHNHEGTRYEQTGGNLVVQDGSRMTITSKDSFINGGNIVVDNSSLAVGSAPTSLIIDNLTLKDNGIFYAGRDFSVTNTLSTGNSYLNTINNTIQDNHIEKLVISSDKTLNFGIDVNSRNETADKFIIDNIETNAYNAGVINLDNINFTGGTLISKEINFQVFDAENISNKIIFSATDKPVLTPIGQYKLSSKGGGYYNLKLTDFNPQVFRGQVATLAAYQNQLIIDNIVLNHIMLVSEEILSSGEQNKYAATLPQFAPYQYSQKDGGVWFKSYVNFETLSMTQNLDVGNNSYGSLIGLDMPLVKLKNGWKFIPTAYIGYNGGHQYFNNVSMYQNGGQGGMMGTFIKDDFIGSVMGYAGGYSNEMSVAGTTDNTGNWFAGTATKLAYNFHPSRNLIIQPTAFASYNIFGQQNWNSQFGIMSMNSGLLNGINVAPGLNIIYGRENWSIYATFQYMYNINDNISGQAGNVDLPSIRMRHGYIEYGIGATKKWKDRLNSYAQVTLRNGGRTGIGFQLGAEYAFDWTDLHNIKKSKAQSPAARTKTIIKSLNKSEVNVSLIDN